MPRDVRLHRSVVVACALAVVSSSAIARAQSVESYNPGANQTVWTVAVQPDGKAIVGGVFTGLGAGTGTTTRNHIGRLNVDGTVDSTFNPGANGDVYAIAVQPDGKIVVGGNFSSLGGGTGLTTTRRYIGRLNSDGSVDASFDPGANLPVYALVVQPDGKILVGGAFSTLGGGGTGTTTRIGLGRLNANGSLDTFNPGVSKIVGAPIVYTMAVQTDGKVVVGGYFNGLGGGTGTTVRNFLGRVNADGTIDGAFNPGVNSISGVDALALQADGRILVGGAFTGLGGGTGVTNRQNIGRLNVDGSVDLGFNPGAEAQVLSLAVQSDGRILAGGYFKFLGAVSTAERKYIGRLNADGSPDNTFNPGAGNVVQGLAVQQDGAVVAVGTFITVGGATGVTTPRNRIARFTNSTPSTEALAVTSGGTVVTWARGGGGPEVWQVAFEASADGVSYTSLGAATRVTGGWQLTGQSLPTSGNLFIRARGAYGTGKQNGSSSISEKVRNVSVNSAPTITSSPSRATPINVSILTDFTVGDVDSGPASLFISATSSNTTLVPNANLGVEGSGASRGVRATPAPNRSGVTLITVSASDGSLTTSTSFVLVVGSAEHGGDFDADRQADVAVFRPSNGHWYILESSTGVVRDIPFGANGDRPVSGDYDGDGQTDVAVFRPDGGSWFIARSSLGIQIVTWGGQGDIPVPADYDADGLTDVAVFRPSNGAWYVLNSKTADALVLTWGGAGDVPVPGDYDGDGKADIAVFRPSTGVWYVLRSATGTFSAAAWGGVGDVAVPGDYDGDGLTDIAVFRPSNGNWYIRKSSTGVGEQVPFGAMGDVPLTGDYDADGKTDVVVFRPSTATWYVRKSSGGVNILVFGASSDIPILRRQ